MTAATVHHHRPTLPVLSMLVAGAALSLGAVAIATDDVSTPQPSPVVGTPAAEEPAVPVATRAGSGSAGVDAEECPFPAPGVVVRC